MSPRVTQNRLDVFMSKLEEAGGSAGNGYLRQCLEWNEELYWSVQGRLIERGEIVAGRGRGGSVRISEYKLNESELVYRDNNIDAENEYKRERDLYPVIRASLEKTWINKFAFDETIVEETHTQGSKNTGGTFTRPDITAVGIRRFEFLPSRLEILTFEIKSRKCINIMGVLEAIAHREAANNSYVIYASSKKEFENSVEADRIFDLSRKYGIGILLTENPNNVETWETALEPLRHDPDPARLDRFLIDLPSRQMKEKLSKWKG